MQARDFVHLQVYTRYSCNTNKFGICDAEELIRTAKDLGMDALAITDHQTLGGVPEFCAAAEKYGIKPIIGCEVTLCDTNNREVSMILLAENQSGYANLNRLVCSQTMPSRRIDCKHLECHHDGLICICNIFDSDLLDYTVNFDTISANNFVQKYVSLFGKDNFYLGVDCNDVISKEVTFFSECNGISLVALNDVRFVNRDDDLVYRLYKCIREQCSLWDLAEEYDKYEDRYLKSAEEMEMFFLYHKEALLNTRRIADRCNVHVSCCGWQENAIIVEEKCTEDFLIHLVLYTDYAKAGKEEIDAYIEYVKDVYDFDYAAKIVEYYEFGEEEALKEINRLLNNIRHDISSVLEKKLVKKLAGLPIFYRIRDDMFIVYKESLKDKIQLYCGLGYTLSMYDEQMLVRMGMKKKILIDEDLM